MIKEELEMEFEQFLQQYVISPIMDYTISFLYNDRCYQFDFVGVPNNPDGSTAYDFVSYEKQWGSKRTTQRFKSLKEAIENARIEGLPFRDIYNKPDSEIIDIS